MIVCVCMIYKTALKTSFRRCICSEVLKYSNDLNETEFSFFLFGGQVFDRSGQSPNPSPDWINQSMWDNIIEVDSKLDSFKGREGRCFTAAMTLWTPTNLVLVLSPIYGLVINLLSSCSNTDTVLDVGTFLGGKQNQSHRNVGLGQEKTPELHLEMPMHSPPTQQTGFQTSLEQSLRDWKSFDSRENMFFKKKKKKDPESNFLGEMIDQGSLSKTLWQESWHVTAGEGVHQGKRPQNCQSTKFFYSKGRWFRPIATLTFWKLPSIPAPRKWYSGSEPEKDNLPGEWHERLDPLQSLGFSDLWVER